MAQVLLAAGNPKAQAAFATLLDDMGCTPIVRAVSGKEALRVLQQELFSLLRIVAPLPDGSGAAAALRAAQPSAADVIVGTPPHAPLPAPPRRPCGRHRPLPASSLYARPRATAPRAPACRRAACLCSRPTWDGDCLKTRYG